MYPDWLRNRNNKEIKKVFVTGKVHVQTCHGMFWGCEYANEIDLTGLDTKDVKDMTSMFRFCSALTDLKLGNLNTANVVTADSMFYRCEVLPKLDVSSFDTSKMTKMSRMFMGCRSLTKLDLTNFNTEKVVTMKEMFRNCSLLTDLDISSFNTMQVQDMNGMFYRCESFTELDLTNFNTTNVINMQMMFYYCSELKSIDLSSFDTRNVTNFASMFLNCFSLESLDLGNFNTANASALGGMFGGCWSLTSIDLGNFETHNATSISGMFDGCRSLTSIDLNNFNTENVTDMSYLFRNCPGLTSIEMGNFNTSKVTDMRYMFYNCTGLTSLDLSTFNTSSLKTATGIFHGCTSLETLDLTNFSCTSSSPQALYNCHATIISRAVTPSPLPNYFFKDYVVDRPYCLQVPKESMNEYLKADGWKTIMPRVLSDDQSRLPLTKYAKYMLGYERKVSGKYATFCLPFNLDVKQWLEELGGASKVYVFMSKGQLDESSRTVRLTVKNLTKGTINAGTPFMVELADGQDEITFFSNNDECDFSVGLPTADKQTVTTAYGVVTMVLGNLFQKQEDLDKTKYRVFNSDGNFGPATWVNIFRAYVYKDDTNSSVKADNFVLAFEDGTTTSVDMIDGMELVTDDAPVYNLNGQRVNGTAKGLLIKNGKKIMVK